MGGLILAFVLALTTAFGGGAVFAPQDALGRAAEMGLTLASSRSGAYPAAVSAEIADLTPTSTPVPSSTATATATATATGTGTSQPTGTPGTTTPTATASSDLASLERMVANVEKLAADTMVPGQSHNGLLAKLGAARAALSRGQKKVAGNNLEAFLNQLNAMQRSGHVSAANYATLLADYNALVARLGTPRATTPTATGIAIPPAPVPWTATQEATAGRRDRERGPDRDEATPRAKPEPPGRNRDAASEATRETGGRQDGGRERDERTGRQSR